MTIIEGGPPPARPASVRTEWFSTSLHGRSLGSNRRAPYDLAHARRIGASTTACGLPAITWEMFYDMPFPSIGVSSCRDCVDVTYRR